MRKLNTSDILGQKFHKLTVLKYLDNRRVQHPCGKVGICHYYTCKCDCGTIKSIERQGLIKGRIKSCGCIIKETRFRTHGYSRTRLYRIFCMMKDRCYNPKIKNYKWYGAKGVEVCKEWKENPSAFIYWSLKNGYNDNLTIERIDCRGNYCPENCCWANTKQQSRNRSNNNKYKNLCLVDWASKLGVTQQALSRRIAQYGWESALGYYRQRKFANNKIQAK